MACFLAPATEAIVSTIVKKSVQKKEQVKNEENTSSLQSGKTSWSTKLGWLNTMLWGGSFLLLIEHIWHGEITYIPPFLTAMKSTEDTAEMIREISTVGVSMAIAITLVWSLMILTVHIRESKDEKKTQTVK